MYYVKKDLFETGLEEGGGREIENYSAYVLDYCNLTIRWRLERFSHEVFIRYKRAPVFVPALDSDDNT